MWVFGALAVYIVLQFVWWAFLLVSKDNDLRALHGELDALGVHTTVTPAPTDQTFWMVVGEGAVFLLLLMLALYLSWRAVRHELALARVQRNFLLATSHELRTPIAGLKLNLQTAGRPALDDAQRKTLRERALADVLRLEALTEKILLSSRLGEHKVVIKADSIVVNEFLPRIIEDAARTYGKGHSILALPIGPESLRTDPTLLRTILDNLLENACKYAPAGTSISVVMDVRPGRCELRVSDEGPGIPAIERELIFQKFHRSGDEETRDTKGTGLGLFIVRACAERLGGTATVIPNHPQGSTFVVQFPIS